jgi:hypothetical protein
MDWDGVPPKIRRESRDTIEAEGGDIEREHRYTDNEQEADSAIMAIQHEQQEEPTVPTKPSV